MESVHVYPNWQDHLIDSFDCFCLPKIEMQENGNVLIIHNEIKSC